MHILNNETFKDSLSWAGAHVYLTAEWIQAQAFEEQNFQTQNVFWQEKKIEYSVHVNWLPN